MTTMTMTYLKQRPRSIIKYKKSGSVKSIRFLSHVAPADSAIRLNIEQSEASENKSDAADDNDDKPRKRKLRSITSKVETHRLHIYSKSDRRSRSSRELLFTQKYNIGERLGKGGFGVVYSGLRRSDGAPVAVKHVPKRKSNKLDAEVDGRIVPSELKLLLGVQDVDGVVKLLDFYERADSFIYVMEKPRDCMDMFDYIDKGKIDEILARNFFSQIVDTVAGCHDRGVVHRDIKDENLLVDMTSNAITLIDFGAAGVLQRGDYTEFDGTRVYSPPEWVRDRRYKWEGLTVWSLGILLFDMVVGDVPFTENEEICEARLKFPSNLSRLVRNLIQGCLQPLEEKRMTMDEVRNHPWLKGGLV